MSLHDELAGRVALACKFCAYLATLSPEEQQEWQNELRYPVEVVSHATVVAALKRRNVTLDESSVRRHRSRHVNR